MNLWRDHVRLNLLLAVHVLLELLLIKVLLHLTLLQVLLIHTRLLLVVLPINYLWALKLLLLRTLNLVLL